MEDLHAVTTYDWTNTLLSKADACKRLDRTHVLDLTLLKTKVESLMTEKVEATTLEVAAIRGSSR